MVKKKPKSTLEPLHPRVRYADGKPAVVVLLIPAGTPDPEAWKARVWARNLAKKISEQKTRDERNYSSWLS